MGENERMVSRSGEADLRRAFSYLDSWSSNGLVDRLLEKDIGVPSRNAAYVLISRGVYSGLVLRDGRMGHFSYRLNAEWRHPSTLRAGYMASTSPAVRKRVTPAPLDVAPARDYAGPAFGSGPLAPTVGLRCDVAGTDDDGELLPCVGGAIADRLRSGFNAMFVAAE